MKRNQCRVARILTDNRNDSNPKTLKFIIGREKERRKKKSNNNNNKKAINCTGVIFRSERH